MKVRLRDIAEATGYSVNTVSHALRDLPDISVATKERIREAARRLDYIPDLQAGSFKSGKRGIIAVILPDIVNPHFTLLFHEIESYFQKKGITSLFMNTGECCREEMNSVRVALGQNVDGVILCPAVGSESCRLLERSGIPYVLVGRYLGIGEDAVVTDDEQGGYLATRHLIGCGHKRIACVRAGEEISSDRERFAGYRRALSEEGIAEDPDMILHLTLRAGSNAEAISDFLTKHPDCRAIFAFSDLLATEILAVAARMGKRVPEEITIVGYDRIADAHPMPFPLTTVGTDGESMGLAAAKLLAERMAEPRTGAGKRILLPVKLETGETRKG